MGHARLLSYLQFADALGWILVFFAGIAFLVHYLDNFFICASSHITCAHTLISMRLVSASLDVPLAPEKIVGPSQVITYLGIEINTIPY